MYLKNSYQWDFYIINDIWIHMIVRYMFDPWAVSRPGYPGQLPRLWPKFIWQKPHPYFIAADCEQKIPCTLRMSQYKSPKHFNPFTIVIKLMQATNNKTKPLLFFSHAISLSTKHLLAKNSHQINEPHITQTASIFCHNKNQFQTLSLVGTYSISLEFRKEPSTRGSSSLC